MLEVIKVKNVALESINFSKHTLILGKKRERVLPDGSINFTITYIELCKLKDNKPFTAVKGLLKCVLAEMKTVSDIDTPFKEITNGTSTKIIAPFLRNERSIYVTDSEGKIFRAIKSEMPFEKTMLTIKAKHSLATCDDNDLEYVLNKHAKQALAQCYQVSLYEKHNETIDSLCTKNDTKVAASTKDAAQKEAKKAA
jgi:hypothetical protein